MTIGRFGAAAALLAVAACGQSETSANTADIGSAASEAQSDIDNYAAAAGAANSDSPGPRAAIPADPPHHRTSSEGSVGNMTDAAPR